MNTRPSPSVRLLLIPVQRDSHFAWKASDNHYKESVQMLLVDDDGAEGGGLFRAGQGNSF